MRNLSRNTEAVADSLAAMIKRELTTSHSCSCHEGYLNSSDPNLITADDRMKLVDWCYDIVEHCRYSRETVASAMEMVDRFLGMPSNSVDAARVSDEALIDPSKFQLLTVAALYTSIKINEKVAISSDQFAEMCRHVYTAEEIEDMERTMLRGLSWRCHVPTAHQVGLSILSLLLPSVNISEVTWEFLVDEMKYLIELAVRDNYFSTQRASTVALAAILNAISDTRSTEERKVLGAFLRVTMECFDFDHPNQIAAARSKLQSSETLKFDVEDERSLDDSMKTFKVSNRSSAREIVRVISG
ncbi:cyclin family protein [Skeletonema marinoi]|uniref:Cyclin family protein n=1 Tax=Skeletonema marinoi TaxID=267567 RepID=A0AAD9DGA9_9STRA|nr:cyclin family protein [Skeletonema marinoi]